MSRLSTLLPTLAVLLFASGPAFAQDSAPIDSLVQQDLRLATIAERLLSANSAFCRQQMPLTGIIVHTRDQYPGSELDSAFANGPVAVEATVPGSTAAALLQQGDGIAAIGGTATFGLQPQGKSPARDSVFDVLAQQAPASPLPLTIVRDGQEQQTVLHPVAGCRALVEIHVDGALNGRSDGRVIQIDLGLANVASDDALAAVFAHELAHLVLEHRRRLSAAGVEKGFFGEFGRNQKLNRQVEVEADRMSVHLLANAGYDPHVAPSFWRSDLGKRVSGGILHSRVYPSAEARAQLMEREIADYMGDISGPSYPGHLLSRRDTPFQ